MWSGWAKEGQEKLVWMFLTRAQDRSLWKRAVTRLLSRLVIVIIVVISWTVKSYSCELLNKFKKIFICPLGMKLRGFQGFSVEK